MPACGSTPGLLHFNSAHSQDALKPCLRTVSGHAAPADPDALALVPQRGNAQALTLERMSWTVTTHSSQHRFGHGWPRSIFGQLQI